MYYNIYIFPIIRLGVMEMDYMKKDETYTVEDVEKMGEVHAELIAGQLVIKDKTSLSHNYILGELFYKFKDFIKSRDGKCKVFSENVALYCNELSAETGKEFYLPDLMIVCGDEGIKEDGIHTVPLFVAEVTSESTKKYDYGEKMITYRDIGVKEYWIIDIQKNILTKYLLEDDYVPITFLHPEKVNVSVYNGELVIDFSDLF